MESENEYATSEYWQDAKGDLDEDGRKKEPPCTHHDGHDWRCDNHAQDPDSEDVLKATGIDTRQYGISGGVSGGRICARCGMVHQWEYLIHPVGPSHYEDRYLYPDKDIADKMKKFDEG